MLTYRGGITTPPQIKDPKAIADAIQGAAMNAVYFHVRSNPTYLPGASKRDRRDGLNPMSEAGSKSVSSAKRELCVVEP